MTAGALLAGASATILAGAACGLGDPTRPPEPADAAVSDAPFDGPIDAEVIDVSVDAPSPDAGVDAGPCVGDLAGGTLDGGIVWDGLSGRLGLATGENDGWWFSPVFDSGQVRDWSTFSWIPLRPSGKPLLDSGGMDMGYTEGVVSMAGNVFLSHLDEQGGMSFADSSGLLHPGGCPIPVYCPTLGQPGVFAGAPFFDGTGDGTSSWGDRIDVTDHTDLEPPNFTVEAWARVASLPVAPNGTGMVVTKGHRSDTGDRFTSYSIEYDGSQRFKCYASIVGGGIMDYQRTVMGTSTFVPPTGFVHVACTFDGTTMRLYVNGVQEGSATLAGTVEYGTPDDDLMIGAWHFFQWFNGWIDEVAVMNFALSASQARDHFLRGALQLRFQLRSCDDLDCVGELFVGPDGTPGTFFTESCRPVGLPTPEGLPDLPLDGLDCDGDGLPDHPGVGAPIPPNRYLQVLAHFNASAYTTGADATLLQLLDVTVCE